MATSSEGQHKAPQQAPPHHLARPASELGMASAAYASRRMATFLMWVLVPSCAALGYALSKGLHEAVFKYSARSDDEKQVLLHSEQAFYISYYFQSLRDSGLLGIMRAFGALLRDTTSEFGHTINVLHRFNVYVEWLTSLAFRAASLLRPALDANDFFMDVLWLHQGLQLAALLLAGRALTRSVVGGVAAVVGYLVNIKVMSRAHTNPLLRENFSLPFLWLQFWCLVRILHAPADVDEQPGRSRKPRAAARAAARQERRSGGGGGGQRGAVALLKGGWAACAEEAATAWWLLRHAPLYRALAVTTFGFALPWQFAPFALFLQAACLLALQLLGYCSAQRLRHMMLAELAGVLAVGVLMFGNAMLLTSLFVVLACAVVGAVRTGWLADAASEAPACARVAGGAARALALLAGVGAVKALLGALMPADSHVFSIFRAKVSDYEDFDTLMYECGGAYNAMPAWVPQELVKSGLHLRAGAAAALLLLTLAVDLARRRASADPALLLLLLQCVAYALIGVPIMRLMVFVMPSLALMGAALGAPALYGGLIAACSAAQPANGGAEGEAAVGATAASTTSTTPAGAPAAAGSHGGGAAAAATAAATPKGVRRRKGRKQEATPARDAPSAGIAKPQRPRRARTPTWVTLVAAWVIAPLLVITAWQHGRSLLREQLEREPTRKPLEGQIGLVHWIRDSTSPSDVIASSLPVSSTIKLATGRPIALHPHAEDADMRLRYRSFYQVYSGMSEDAVYAAIAPLGARYVVVSFSACDNVCSGGYGLNYTARAGVGEVRGWVERALPTLPPRQREVATRLSADGDWGETEGVDGDGRPLRRDQFCYLATEVPLRHFTPRFQNQEFLVLEVKR